MEKYLFNDGTNVVREVQSKEELQTLLLSSTDPEKTRIWIFNTSEWITYAEFSKRTVTKVSPLKTPVVREEKKKDPAAAARKRPGQSASVVKFLVVLITGAAIFLVYNFTRVRWHTASSLSTTAARPANTPVVDVDSLIQVIETDRGQKLDKVTLTNLRIRNTWPDRIELKVKTDRDTSEAGSRFYGIELSIDNSTGYNIDNAIVELKEWKNGSVNTRDTFHFNNIGYSALANRSLANEYRGDSLSVSFLTVRSRAFNFCYSSDKESNYGNLNDRWFCRE